MSAFTWLDHSDKERRKVLEAIDRFKETTTRDELGFAVIRDGFADHFFPGTGVLMTRARYFLFIPWMYLELERKGRCDDVAARARRWEVQLIETLGEEQGTIGKLAKATLKRLPSSIYWLGLERWGIRTVKWTQSDYHRWLEHDAGRDRALDDDGEPLGQSVPVWHAGIPRPPAGFPKEATLELTSVEAAYLRERIRLKIPASVLARLLQANHHTDVDFIWEHPDFASFPAPMREMIEHARCFAETMHGASYLYNLMLAEKAQRDSASEFRELAEEWVEEMRTRESALRSWNREAFWSTVRRFGSISASTHAFVNRWLELRPWESVAKACDDKSARALILQREEHLKGPSRARLVNVRALELWGGASGTRRLDYRWSTAKRLLADIAEAADA